LPDDGDPGLRGDWHRASDFGSGYKNIMNSKETVYRLIQKHEDMMRRLDEWFAHLHTLYPDKIKCERGCALCCHGLFDVSLADAVQIIRGYDLLPEDIRMSVRERASLIQRQIKGASGMAAEPLFLNLSQGEIDELVERIDGVRCPFLGTDDECLIYDQRPLACRLEGVPMVDRHDGLFGDWCELNFQNGVEKLMRYKDFLDFGVVIYLGSGVFRFGYGNTGYIFRFVLCCFG